MPSSNESRSPASTFSATGFNRWSVIVSSLILNPSKVSNAPNRCRSAPEQQEQHTNITVHGEKRSVQLAEIIRFDKGMFIAQQRRDHGNAHPRGPRQSKAERQPPEKRDHTDMHAARDEQRLGDPKFFRHGKKPRAPIVLNILARVEHVKPADPPRNRRAKDEQARIEAARKGEPCGGRRDAQRKPEEEMRPVGEALREGIEKQNGHCQWRELQGKRIEPPRGDEKHSNRINREKPRKLQRKRARCQRA